MTLQIQQDKIWWYATGDQKFGPYSARELKTIANSGKFVSTDLVWKEGYPNWVAASSIKGLIPPSPANKPPPLPPTHSNPESLNTAIFTAHAIFERAQKELQRFVLGNLSDQVSRWFNKMLKKTFLISAISLATIVILVLIFMPKGAVECDDSDVKALIIDISNDTLRPELIGQAILTQLPRQETAAEAEADNIRLKNLGLYGNFSYEAWNKAKEKDDYARKVIEYVDNQIAEMNITPTNIRINSKDDQIKKTECEANLKFSNGKTYPIEYTAQYNEDGQLYVKVSN